MRIGGRTIRWAAQATKDVWAEGSTKQVAVPWGKLGKVVRPKGGNTGVLIAGSGVGKTTFMTNWVTKANLRALYVSSDTSPHDLTVQLGALSTDDTCAAVERRLLASQTWRDEYGRHIASSFPNLVLDFSPSPSMDRLDQMCHALDQLWGQPPEILIMDTASNVEMEDRSSYSEWERVWLEAGQIARRHNLFFMFCHHVKQGPARNGKQAPELSDGLWGSEKFPEFVFGAHLPRPRQFVLTVRKNRRGPRDVPVAFTVDYGRAQITEGDEE